MTYSGQLERHFTGATKKKPRIPVGICRASQFRSEEPV